MRDTWKSGRFPISTPYRRFNIYNLLRSMNISSLVLDLASFQGWRGHWRIYAHFRVYADPLAPYRQLRPICGSGCRVTTAAGSLCGPIQCLLSWRRRFNVRILDGFKFERGLDLTGYEDGTENPENQAAIDAAIVNGKGSALDGSSFVATQRWLHDLDHFNNLSQAERDDIIGRRLSDNEELEDASVSAHVKRTAQESFDPEAFLVRRSMPWADATGMGLYFVAFGKTFDAFEAQLQRMVGLEDGITDGLFRFSRPLTGSYFWCPPVLNNHLNLGAVGIDR